MPESIQELFEAVRGACSSGAWSRGVDLVRSDAVCGERDDGDEVVLRVTVPGRAASPRVVLMPNDLDWECDCSSREDACEHVAASTIALRRARGEGRALPGEGSATAGTVSPMNSSKSIHSWCAASVLALSAAEETRKVSSWRLVHLDVSMDAVNMAITNTPRAAIIDITMTVTEPRRDLADRARR